MSKMSGQSIMDRVTAAKHSIAGQGLAKTVCKATTEEVMGPKKKHLDYLLQCTNEPNVSIPQLADLLIERTQNTSWVIVFKALVTIHNLMNYGNERFTQYLASNNCTFNLANFIDKTGVQGYDMSTFIRRYSKYLNEKATSYRVMAFDFCKVKRGRDDGLLRTMNSDKILKTLPVLQKQIDALLDFDCTPNELTNGVINACFMLMFKDLIRLFACYNDGTINLLEKYFDMNKKNCKEALDIYKKFLVRMDKVAEFLKTAENVGIDKGDIPDLAKAPASLLDALEQHLQSLDGKKGAQPTSVAKPSGFSSAINTIASNSSIQISEEEKKRILDDENKRLQQLKLGTNVEQKERESGTTSTTNPFATSVGQPASTTTSQSPSQQAKPSDDLLNLSGNPFADSVQNVMVMNSGVNAMQPPQAQNAFGAPPPGWGAQTSAPGAGFGDSNFAVFPNGAPATSGFDAFGEVMKPQSSGGQESAPKQQEKLSGKDLDSSLVHLAGSLAINGSSNKVKTQHQWQPKGDQKLTGGSNWTPQGNQPMTWSQQPAFQQSPQHMPATGMMYGGQPGMGSMMQPGMQPMGGARPMGSPAMGMGMPMGAPMMGQPGVGMGQPMYGAGMRPGMPAMSGMGQQPRPPASQPNDPFGAL